ncbi:hypothetical protein ABGB18_26735 [Nonomuraea sp. B12E4]|uniref:hypothetical protein n=1 Tax=Nonomuraea sp. B12E4 TaxID=3153564 RepID=UPI00325C5E7D
MLVISALVAVVALIGLISVARNRRRGGATDAVLAETGPYLPTPQHAAAEPDDGILWRRDLMGAAEAAAQPLTPAPAPGEQENHRPGPLARFLLQSEDTEEYHVRGRHGEHPGADEGPGTEPGHHEHPAPGTGGGDDVTETLPRMTGDHPNP